MPPVLRAEMMGGIIFGGWVVAIRLNVFRRKTLLGSQKESCSKGRQNFASNCWSRE